MVVASAMSESVSAIIAVTVINAVSAYAREFQAEES
jgi:hypothetical protein